MVMGLCLLVYSLGQKALRQALARAKQTISNQLGKPTATPTMRWVFQCFMSIHLVTVAGVKHIANLTDERCWVRSKVVGRCRKGIVIKLTFTRIYLEQPQSNCPNVINFLAALKLIRGFRQLQG